METKNISVERLGIKSGILVCLALIAYFMLMKLLNLADVAELRWLNLLIMFGGVMWTLRFYRRRSNNHVDYLEGIALSFLTSVISVVLFTVFIYIYFSQVDPVLLQILKGNAPMMGQYLTPFSAALTVMVEGIISGLILSFAIMQYYKEDPNNAKKEHHHTVTHGRHVS